MTDPRVLVGARSADDAAVYQVAPDRAIVATVDFFTPIVDDPAAFGAIAAANALSDVYAMGGTPLFALSLVAFPRDRLATGVLEQIVRGGAEKLQEASVPVVGGHSIDDGEPKFGYSVTGEVHPERIVTAQGARPGDRLYLTKPLGTGVVTTAIKRGLCPAPLVEGAIATMTELNRRASEAMVAAGARAATDVTGFGLLGHLANMGVGAEIEWTAVPFLPGVADLAQRDLFPSGTRRNHQSLAGRVDWDGLPERDQLLLCDAQTSGGLLVAIPPEAADRFERRAERAWRIGTVTEGDRIAVRVG